MLFECAVKGCGAAEDPQVKVEASQPSQIINVIQTIRKPHAKMRTAATKPRDDSSEIKDTVVYGF